MLPAISDRAHTELRAIAICSSCGEELDPREAYDRVEGWARAGEQVLLRELAEPAEWCCATCIAAARAGAA